MHGAQSNPGLFNFVSIAALTSPSWNRNTLWTWEIRKVFSAFTQWAELRWKMRMSLGKLLIIKTDMWLAYYLGLFWLNADNWISWCTSLVQCKAPLWYRLNDYGCLKLTVLKKGRGEGEMSSVNTKVYGPVNLNFKNLSCSCLCMLEDVWMKKQNCIISVLCGGKKEKN